MLNMSSYYDKLEIIELFSPPKYLFLLSSLFAHVSIDISEILNHVSELITKVRDYQLDIITGEAIQRVTSDYARRSPVDFLHCFTFCFKTFYFIEESLCHISIIYCMNDKTERKRNQNIDFRGN